MIFFVVDEQGESNCLSQLVRISSLPVSFPRSLSLDTLLHFHSHVWKSLPQSLLRSRTESVVAAMSTREASCEKNSTKKDTKTSTDTDSNNQQGTKTASTKKSKTDSDSSKIEKLKKEKEELVRAEKIASLASLGFDMELCKIALEMKSWDSNAAADLIFANLNVVKAEKKKRDDLKKKKEMEAKQEEAKRSADSATVFSEIHRLSLWYPACENNDEAVKSLNALMARVEDTDDDFIVDEMAHDKNSSHYSESYFNDAAVKCAVSLDSVEAVTNLKKQLRFEILTAKYGKPPSDGSVDESVWSSKAQLREFSLLLQKSIDLQEGMSVLFARQIVRLFLLNLKDTGNDCDSSNCKEEKKSDNSNALEPYSITKDLSFLSSMGDMSDIVRLLQLIFPHHRSGAPTSALLSK